MICNRFFLPELLCQEKGRRQAGEIIISFIWMENGLLRFGCVFVEGTRKLVVFLLASPQSQPKRDGVGLNLVSTV